MRLFIAIPIKNTIEIKLFQNQLREQIKYSRVKWVEQENFHLTLKFIGETQEFYINAINLILSEINKKLLLPNLKTAHFDYFGSKKQISTLLLKIEEESNLIALQNVLEKNLEELGFEKNRHSYIPHLTIGRIKYYKYQDNIPELFKKFNIQSISLELGKPGLYKSTLTEKGPVYERLSD